MLQGAIERPELINVQKRWASKIFGFEQPSNDHLVRRAYSQMPHPNLSRTLAAPQKALYHFASAKGRCHLVS